MPANSTIDSPVGQQLLAQLGDRLRLARRSQSLSTVELAIRVGISRTTLRAVENGDPSPTMGTYVRVLSALGLLADLALVGTGTPQPPTLGGPKAQPFGLHRAQDLQSLLMHQEAVRLLRAQPSLALRLQATLGRWKQRDDPNSLPLRERWARIIEQADWDAALADTDEGRQLRQASPLATLLPEETRLSIIQQVKALKEGADAAA